MAKSEKKGFVKEFKEFITKGNIMDMAVGIIVGSAFTAIVNSLCNNILKPVINFILLKIIGADSLSNCYTFLNKVEKYDEELKENVIDLENSIYIDWGTFINAIINFLLIALVLFVIIKAFNRLREASDELKAKIEAKNNKEEVKEEKAE